VKNPVTRTKEYVSDHRTKLAASAGVVVGALGMHAFLHYRGMNVLLETSLEDLTRLMDTPGSAIRFHDPIRRITVNLVTETTES
jgi:hypothetical protein